MVCVEEECLKKGEIGKMEAEEKGPHNTGMEHISPSTEPRHQTICPLSNFRASGLQRSVVQRTIPSHDNHAILTEKIILSGSLYFFYIFIAKIPPGHRWRFRSAFDPL
jgi:hypothetical protein